MKVYIVQTHDYYASSIEGVFASEAVAKKKADEYNDRGSVTEFEVEAFAEGLAEQLAEKERRSW